MPRYIVKLAENEFVEWSTVVDSPISSVMSRDEMFAHAKKEGYPDQSVARADESGCSATWMSAEETAALFDWNRAGPGETTATLQEIRENY